MYESKISPENSKFRIPVSIPNKQFVELANRQSVYANGGSKGKRNPISLRFIIAHIIQFFHRGVKSDANKAFSAAGQKYASGKEGTKNIGNFSNLTTDFLQDERAIRYLDLEAISQSRGIPSGTILLLSRLYSVVRKYPEDEMLAAEFISANRKCLAILEDIQKTKTLRAEHFEQMEESFFDFHTLENKQKDSF